jgi:predicted RNA-binding protein with PIN domain
MPYIIDGNNLIGCCPEIEIADPQSRDKLISIILTFQEAKNVKITIVFDGASEKWGNKTPITPKLTVIFPHFGRTADDEIKSIIDGYSNQHEVMLISSDRELKDFAKDKGIKTVNSIEFYYDLKKAARKTNKNREIQKRVEARLSQSEVEQWLKIFEKNI